MNITLNTEYLQKPAKNIFTFAYYTITTNCTIFSLENPVSLDNTYIMYNKTQQLKTKC